MKISKKERNLLIVLGLTILVYVFYTFVYTPQMVRLNEVKNNLESQRETIRRMETAMRSQEEIESEISEIKKELLPVIRSYFGNMNQEESIVILHDFGVLSNMKVSSISFTEPEPSYLQSEEQAEQAQVTEPEVQDAEVAPADKAPSQDSVNNIMRMSANVGFKGSYEQLMAFLNQMGTYHKNIVSTTMIIEQNDEALLEGEILLDFYSVNGVDKYIEKSDSILANNAVPKIARNNIFHRYAAAYTVTDIPSQYASNDTPIGYEDYQ